jgi:formate dehydrogenase iron-sulfur subunit
VFYISDVDFERLGFPNNLHEQPLPKLSKAALGDVPTVVTIGGSLLAGLYWITQRRQEVLAAEGKQKAGNTDQERR